ncbi:alpha/beta hydrolase [Massilia solisilvae]|uniref:Alpha/beta hydrolase n=1 Tax=Massilia solisilvae TaxID=1811225 RepID=A0ABT2BG93_9BURK|nr:alpha/beta hydrolase [Massilia solisilvae]MCS0607540.1 alpha/beta hydrolase [Massilia solisilvae]
MLATSRPNTIRAADGTELFYRTWGEGRPVLFVASWSMPSESWQYQMMHLLDRGLRVIAFDRRGHGRSGDPGRGYDFDTLADDIAAVVEALSLRGVTLVGHSMGCNEIVRYLARHGTARVARAALLGTVTPYLPQAPDNPDGIDQAVFDTFRNDELARDFPQWVDDNMVPFVFEETPQGMKGWIRQLAFTASLHALRECHAALTHTDFRADLPRIDIPVLLIAGDADATCPLELTAKRSAALLPNATLKVYEGAPHGMFITHMDRVNADLLEFIGQ